MLREPITLLDYKIVQTVVDTCNVSTTYIHVKQTFYVNIVTNLLKTPTLQNIHHRAIKQLDFK